MTLELILMKNNYQLKTCPVCSRPLLIEYEYSEFYHFSSHGKCKCGYYYFYQQGDTKEEIGPFVYISTYDKEEFRNYPFNKFFIFSVYGFFKNIKDVVKLFIELYSSIKDRVAKLLEDIINFN
jgi:hypothetical protein